MARETLVLLGAIARRSQGRGPAADPESHAQVSLIRYSLALVLQLFLYLYSFNSFN